jgi:hypothetical protein
MPLLNRGIEDYKQNYVLIVSLKKDGPSPKFHPRLPMFASRAASIKQVAPRKPAKTRFSDFLHHAKGTPSCFIAPA